MSARTRRRVVVTGIGVICGLGTGRREVWETAIAGRSGAGPITSFDTGAHDVSIACEARGFDPSAFLDHRTARRADRVTQFAVGAARLAEEDSGVTVDGDGRRAGCVIGTGTGGNHVREDNHRVMLERGPDRVSPFTIPHSMLNMPAAMIAMEIGLRGPVFAAVTACAAGTDAIGLSAAIIARGDADVMFAGGSDAMITPFHLAGFDAMRVLSHRNDAPETAARPFDAGRDGFLIGEGSAVLVLEEAEGARARGARIICEVAGYGASADAHHITDPDPTGASQARAIAAAIADAGLRPEDIRYVNAHGGASRPGDPSEVAAIRSVLGEAAAATPVSATKSMHGHCMGATGAIEGALTALAVAEGVIPPTINLSDPDPACAGVDHVANTARWADVPAALSTNNGLGGHNAAVVLTRWEGA